MCVVDDVFILYFELCVVYVCICLWLLGFSAPRVLFCFVLLVLLLASLRLHVFVGFEVFPALVL